MVTRLRHRLLRIAVLLGALVALAFTSTASANAAHADSASAGGDVSVAQSLDGRELTVVLRRVTGTPGILRVDVVTHAGTAPGRLSLSAVPTGTGTTASSTVGTVTSTASVSLSSRPGSSEAALRIDRPGPWALAVSDGTTTARIPFVVAAQALSPAEIAVFAGFIGAGGLLVVTIVVAVWARRTWVALVPAGGVVAGLSVAVCAGILSASLPLPPQPGLAVDATTDNVAAPYAVSGPRLADLSRPAAAVDVVSAPSRAGVAGRLVVGLSDSATGLPVDDLVVHDGALVHLLIVGPSGRLWHEHPVLVSAGRLSLSFTPDLPGHYAVSAEFERRGGGVQIVRSGTGIDVDGTAPAGTAPAVATGRLSAATPRSTSTVDGSTVAVSTSGLVAGQPASIDATVAGPADLQLWLGMLGHIVVAGPVAAGPAAPSAAAVGRAVQSAAIWGHGHSMGPLTAASSGTGTSTGMSMSMSGSSAAGGTMTGMSGMAPVNGDSAPDETVAAYGPDVPFTYEFSAPGTYRVWIQVERGYRILTIPLVVVVAPSTPPAVTP